MEPLYNHQIDAIELLWNNDCFALLMEMGTGKSRPIIDDWLARVTLGKAQDLVVIAPKGSYLNWLDELQKWIPPEVHNLLNIAPWISGANKAQLESLQNLLHAKSPRFLTMNVEALNREGVAREYLLKFITGKSVIGCIDESTTIAHESASRTKFILRTLAPRFKARRILTGLVAPESPMDLYSQYYFLDRNIIGMPTFMTFRRRYAITEMIDFTPPALKAKGIHKRPIEKVVGFKNLEELTQKILAKSYRVTKDQVLDLLPKVYEFWDVELTEEQHRMYAQMKAYAYTLIAEEDYASAKTKLGQLQKMMFILCGHVKNESGEVMDIPENRTNAVMEILHNYTGKAVIWCPYPQALRKIRAKLQEEFGPRSAVGYWGETTLDERVEANERLQLDDECRFIVSNQSVGGKGNNWVQCGLCIYFANGFDNEDRQQSEDRIHRIGQTKSVTYIDLRSRGTIDEYLIKVLRKKITISSTLQGDEYRKWLI